MSGQQSDERFATASMIQSSQEAADMAQVSSNGKITCVAGSMTSQTLLAANASRKKARIFNGASTVLLVACSTGPASTTSYTGRIQQSDEWPVPDGYTGPVQGMWTSDPLDGCAMVTEFS